MRDCKRDTVSGLGMVMMPSESVWPGTVWLWSKGKGDHFLDLAYSQVSGVSPEDHDYFLNLPCQTIACTVNRIPSGT